MFRLYEVEQAFLNGYKQGQENAIVKSKWKIHKNGDATCDHCHFVTLNAWDFDNWQAYCGKCGARMTDIYE